MHTELNDNHSLNYYRLSQYWSSNEGPKSYVKHKSANFFISQDNFLFKHSAFTNLKAFGFEFSEFHLSFFCKIASKVSSNLTYEQSYCNLNESLQLRKDS